jgi:hypothetical protein
MAINRLFIGLILLLISPILKAQIVVDTSRSNTAHVLQLLGPGVPFSNVSVQGNRRAIGSFSDSSSIIEIEKGIVLTTGYAASINKNPALPLYNFPGSYNHGLENIPELSPLISGNSKDGLILKFDFQPQTPLITFDYVFASLEYNGYACSEYSDPIAIFISGPGIDGEKNIAVVPNTEIPVSINSINNIVNPDTLAGLCTSTFPQYFNPFPLHGLIFNGSTVKMQASQEVTPCEQYTIRIMIADGSDESFDSALFIKINDQSTGKYIIPSPSISSNTAYEDCTPLKVTFVNNNYFTNNYAFHYYLSGTASNGIDYSPYLPDSVYILAGTHSTEITLNPIDDSIFEAIETLYFNFQNGCDVKDVLFRISEKPTLEVTSSPVDVVCPGQAQIELQAEVLNGFPPYSYSWNRDTSLSPSITITPLEASVYQLYVKDYCGSLDTIDFNVDVLPLPDPVQLNFDPQSSILSFNPLSNSTHNYWVFNETELYLIASPSMKIVKTGSYAVYSEDENGCFAYSDTILFDQAASSPALYLIYPNPAKNELTVTLNEDGYMEVFGLDGRIHAKLPLNNGIQTVSVADFPLGMYIMRIHTPSGVESRKILITH